MDPRASATASSTPSDIQVRHATIVRCDIVESVHIKKQQELDEHLDFRRAFEDIVWEVAAQHGGEVKPFEGDAAMVVFGHSDAHEDMVESAVSMGLDMTRAIRRMQVPGSGPVEVRVGIATGPTAVMREARGPGSETVASLRIDIAERLRGLAQPGQVIVDDVTRKLAGGFFEYHDLGAVPVKGFEEGVQAWRVVGPSSVQSRFEAQRLRADATTIIGRDAELAALSAAWTQARAGHGQTVRLTGEAGMGKSRLARAVLAQAAADGGGVLEIDCTPSTRNTPLYPLAVLLRRTAGISSSTSEREKYTLARQLLTRFLGADSDAFDYLAPLFGLQAGPLPLKALPAETRDRTIAIVLTMLRALAADRPVALLCEDLHWVDHTTGEVLARVAGEIATLPTLMVVTSRPGADPGPIDPKLMTTLELTALDRDHATAMVRALGRGEIPDSDVAAIVDRCEGIPLVLEEVTRHTLDATHHTAQDAATARDATAMPTALDLVVQSRLAGVPDLMSLVQAAAVLGRDFSRSVLERMLPSVGPDQISGGLTRLAELGLLDRPASAAPSRLRFKHVMIMEAVYKTLLGRDRLLLHSHAADTLSATYRASPEGAADVVAEHLRKARRFQEAVELRLTASIDTAARGAYVETQGHCQAAIDMIDALPPGRARTLLHVRLLIQLAVALTGQYGYAASAVEEAYANAQRLLGDEADPALLYPIMRGLATFNLVRGRLAAAHALSLKAMALAERSGRADFRIDAMSVHCYATLYYRDLAECRSWIERCLALYRDEHGERLTYPVPQDAGTAALALLPTVAWLLGDADGAERAITEGLAHVEQLDRDFDRALMNAWIAGARYTQRRYLLAAQHAAQAIEIAGRHNYGEWHAIAGLMALLSQAALDAAPQALQQAQAICEAFRQRDIGLNASYYLWALARGHVRCGNREIATALLGAATHFARASEETRMDAELMIMVAEIEADDGKACALLAEAVRVALRQGAVPTALRAAAERSLRDPESVTGRDAGRAVLEVLDGRAAYPEQPDWMRERLGVLWKAPA